MTEFQKKELIAHLETHIYLTAKEICDYVRKRYQVRFTPKGMTSLFHQLGFTYKKPSTYQARQTLKLRRRLSENTRESRKRKPPKIRFTFWWGLSHA